MKINMNARCRFILTEAGASLWNAHYDEVPPEYRPAPVPAGQEVRTQLWVAFQVFGPAIYMGMPQVHFTDNCLEIEE